MTTHWTEFEVPVDNSSELSLRFQLLQPVGTEFAA